MDPPDTQCKADKCLELRVNESLCGSHTHKLHPIYLRYKRIEAELPNFDSIADSIPDLVSAYGKCARVYQLRNQYRNALKPIHHDPGHAKAISDIRERMLMIHDRLVVLTETNATEEKQVIVDDEDDADELPMGVEDIIQEEYNTVQESKRRYNPNDPDRLLCGTAVINYLQRKLDIENATLDAIAKKAVSRANVLVNVIPSAFTPELFNELVEGLNRPVELRWHSYIARLVTESGVIACRDKEDITHCLGVPKSGPSMLGCCTKKQIEVMLRTNISQFTVKCLMGYVGAANNLVRRRLFFDVKYKPPNLEFTLRVIKAATNKVALNPIIIPTAYFEHACNPITGRQVCKACCDEIQLRLAYKTLPRHAADEPLPPRVIGGDGATVRHNVVNEEDEAKLIRASGGKYY